MRARHDLEATMPPDVNEIVLVSDGAPFLTFQPSPLSRDDADLLSTESTSPVRIDILFCLV